MTTLRMDNVGIVVDDLKSAIAFFVELGLETRPPVTVRVCGAMIALYAWPMVRRRRRTQRQDGRDETRTAGKGSNGFLGQIGQFETANGIPHGPAAIALAIVVASLVVPVRRLVRYVISR